MDRFRNIDYLVSRRSDAAPGQRAQPRLSCTV
jgi:hypothetical protein